LVPAAGSPAYVGELRVDTLASSAAIYSAFVHGSVDWAVVPPAQLADAARRFGQGGFRPLAAELFYGFNLSDPVFADVRFREAVVEAIDRAGLAANAYGRTALAFNGLVVDGVEGHQTDPCGATCRYDPAAARALLAQLPPSSRTATFAIDYDQDPTQDQVARTIQADLKAVGLTVTLRPRSAADYATFVLSGHPQLFRLGWVAAYPSADAFLSPLFASGATTNVTHLSDTGVDSLLQLAHAQPDPTKRTADYQQAEGRILADVPVVPVAQFKSHDVIASRVHGLLINPLGTFDPATVWVD
jgi:peptide/nickel transport system substrate-binding protein/oligopeptide transport system substrate-binding protein